MATGSNIFIIGGHEALSTLHCMHGNLQCTVTCAPNMAEILPAGPCTGIPVQGKVPGIDIRAYDAVQLSARRRQLLPAGLKCNHSPPLATSSTVTGPPLGALAVRTAQEYGRPPVRHMYINLNRGRRGARLLHLRGQVGYWISPPLAGCNINVNSLLHLAGCYSRDRRRPNLQDSAAA